MKNEPIICDRFKTVRNALEMKQDDFARAIKTTQGHISDIENKRKNVSDRLIEIICLKYNINESWFRYGTGTMFKTCSSSQEFDMFINDVMSLEDDAFKKRFVTSLPKLDESTWIALENLIKLLTPS